jgi:hypothetical protein
MSQLNANTPYIECKLRKIITGLDYDLSGFIFGVKSIINYPILFHFQSVEGAVVWNMPISAFKWKDDYEIMDEDEQKRLSLLESWDAQSYSISTITFKFLQNKQVDVFCRDGEWRRGIYLDSKCFHFIQLDNGNFCIQPNNLLRWHNPDFIFPYDKKSPPKFKINNPFMSSEHIDMSYAKSPYYIYRPSDINH